MVTPIRSAVMASAAISLLVRTATIPARDVNPGAIRAGAKFAMAKANASQNASRANVKPAMVMAIV
jgi:hypothetical protein